MNDVADKDRGIDLARYAENRAKYPPEQLLKNAGQYVAWSPDGMRILASGPDEYAVERELAICGIDPGQVVFGYIDAIHDPPTE